MDISETLKQVDIDVFRALNLARENAFLDAIMIGLTIAGVSYVIVLLVVPLWIKGKREAAFDLVVLVVVVTVLTELVKLAVDRPRPFVELSGVHTILSSSGPSFPSAHASRAFAVACLVALNSQRRYGILAYLLAGLISVSRVYLGVHWPSDVFFGALFGLLIALAMVAISKRSSRYQRARAATTRGIAHALSRIHRPSRSATVSAVVV